MGFRCFRVTVFKGFGVLGLGCSRVKKLRDRVFKVKVFKS